MAMSLFSFQGGGGGGGKGGDAGGGFRQVIAAYNCRI